MSAALPWSFIGSFLIAVFALQWWMQPSYHWSIYWILACLGCTDFVLKLRGILSAVAVGICLALLTVGRSTDRGLYPVFDPFIAQKNVVIEGHATGLPDDRGMKLQITVVTDLIQTASGSTIPVTGQILVTDRSMYVIPDPGDRIRIRGILERAEPGTSYERYLRMRDIGATMDVRGIEILGQTNTEPFTRMLWHIRSRFERRIKQTFPDPSAGLLTGLLTGANGALTPAIEEEFRRTGLSHIVAISGSNITIILSLMGSMLFFLPLRWRFIPLAVGIIVFTLFVGASASVIRAAVTGIIGLVALQSGRQNDARIATGWTACLMVLWNPWMLWADAGFQLSFLAVIGLIELTPILEPMLKGIPETGGIREALTATLAAQFTAVPWGVRLFGSLPLISPLANILVAPLLPLGMLFGFLAVLAQYINPLFARMIGLPAVLLLDAVIAIAGILSRLPGAVIGDLQISSMMMCVYYFLLAATVIWFRRPAVQKD